MKKAERIFGETYTECRCHIKQYGYTENSGFTSLFCKENEYVCKRTCNAIQKLIDSERHKVATDLELGVIAEERFEFLNNALNMVQKTLENDLEFLEGLKGLKAEVVTEPAEVAEVAEVAEAVESKEEVKEVEKNEVDTKLVGSKSQVAYARSIQNKAIEVVNSKIEELKILSFKGVDKEYDLAACEKAKESLLKDFNRHSDAMWYFENHRLFSVGCVNEKISECVKFLKTKDKSKKKEVIK